MNINETKPYVAEAQLLLPRLSSLGNMDNLFSNYLDDIETIDRRLAYVMEKARKEERVTTNINVVSGGVDSKIYYDAIMELIADNAGDANFGSSRRALIENLSDYNTKRGYELSKSNNKVDKYNKVLSAAKVIAEQCKIVGLTIDEACKMAPFALYTALGGEL